MEASIRGIRPVKQQQKGILVLHHVCMSYETRKDSYDKIVRFNTLLILNSTPFANGLYMECYFKKRIRKKFHILI